MMDGSYLNITHVYHNVPSSNYTSRSDLWIFDTCLLSVMICCGLLGDLLILLAFVTDKSLRSSVDIIVINIIIVDMVVTAEYLPVVMAAVIQDDNVLNYTWCQIHGISIIVCSVVIIESLSLIAASRCILVRNRVMHMKLFTLKHTLVLIGLLWLLAILLTIPTLLGWGRVGYLKDSFTCSFDYCFDMSYTIFLYGIAFGIPLAITFGSYALIFATVRKSQRRIAAHSSSSTTSVPIRKNRHLLSSFFLSCLFLVLWCPFCIVTIVDIYMDISSLYVKYFTWIGIFNSCLNSFVFLFVNKFYRTALRSLPCFEWLRILCCT